MIKMLWSMMIVVRWEIEMLDAMVDYIEIASYEEIQRASVL